MLRFRLKTLLAFAMVVALAVLFWTLVPPSVWTLLPDSIWTEEGSLVLRYPEPANIPCFVDGFGDYETIIIPLWLAGLLAIVAVLTFVGMIYLSWLALSRFQKPKFTENIHETLH